MTYTVIARNPNSWATTPTGNAHQITYACGHRHRTLSGAVQCLRSISGSTDSIHARVEMAAKDQMYDGEPVDTGSYEYVLQCLRRMHIRHRTPTQI